METEDRDSRNTGSGSRGWLRRFQDRSIRFKLLLNFVLIIVLSIVTLGAVGSTLYQRSMEEAANEHTSQMLEQVKNNIAYHFGEMENIIHYASGQEAVRRFFASAGGTVQQPAPTGAEVLAAISIYEQRHSEIAGMLLVNSADVSVSSKLQRISRDPLTTESWYLQAIARPGEVVLTAGPIGRNIRGSAGDSADQILSFARAVQDPATGQIQGVILIDMRLGIIRETIESVSLGKSGFIYITDQAGGIVYSAVNPIVYRIRGEWLESGSNPVIKSIGQREYQIMHRDFAPFGWKIVGVFPLDELQHVLIKLRYYTVLVVLVTLLCAFIASWFFTNSIISPVRKLRSLMRKVEEGELNLRFRGRTNDELGQLGQSFNRMVQEIDRLIQMVYTEQQEKREAELKILQAQIKPHFLYNTLDTIQWMAQDRDADDIVEMIGALTHLFRIGLSRGHEVIPLSEELRHVDSYLIIQMARYEGKLDYRIELPEELGECRVLKLILQPLVENAIYHGIKTKRGRGEIVISGRREEGRLLLSVQDDGMGMKPQVLERIRYGLDNPGQVDAKSGYGLFNVHERIRLSYGPAYGVQVESEYGAGTRIEVVLPLTRVLARGAGETGDGGGDGHVEIDDRRR